MWLYQAFCSKGSVHSLKIHLIANNIFLRCWHVQSWLPGYARSGAVSRLVHLLFSLMIYYLIALMVSQSTYDHDSNSVIVFPFVAEQTELKCFRRTLCKQSCLTDHFPMAHCISADTEIQRGEFLYDRLWIYPAPLLEVNFTALWTDEIPAWEKCREFALDDELDDRISLDRDFSIKKTHSCFLPCRQPNAIQNGVIDTRPHCVGTEAIFSHLLCVEPKVECPKANLEGIQCLRKEETFCFVPWHPFLVALLGLSFLALFDFLSVAVAMQKPPTAGKSDADVYKCLGLCVLSITGITVVTITFGAAVRLYAYSTYNPPVAWTVWGVGLFVDQICGSFFQFAFWYLALRRCGKYPVTHTEYVVTETGESLADKIRGLIRPLVDHAYFRIGVNILIGVMVLMISLKMSIPQMVTDPLVALKVDNGIRITDLTLLCLFMLEIMLKLAAYGVVYLKDVLNFLDAFVVIISFAFAIVEQVTGDGLGIKNALLICRFIRLTRIFGETKTKVPSTYTHFSTTLERGINILSLCIMESQDLTTGQVDNVKWVVGLLVDELLYHVSAEGEKVEGKQFYQDEILTWKEMITEYLGKDPWRENELETLWLGRMKQNGGTESLRESTAAVLTCFNFEPYMRERVETYLRDNLLSWSFNPIAFSEITGPSALPVIYMTCLKKHGLDSLFEIDDKPMLQYVAQLEKGYGPTVPFHSSLHAIDVLQGVHLFLEWIRQNAANSASGNGVAASLNGGYYILAPIFAASILNYQHPGVGNATLVAMGHPLAWRYNDEDVLENHHISAAFRLLQDRGDSSADPFQNMTEDQYTNLRRMVMRLIFSTTETNHGRVISALEALQLSSKPRDKEALLCALFRAANLCFYARASGVFEALLGKFMDEKSREAGREAALRHGEDLLQLGHQRPEPNQSKSAISVYNIQSATNLDVGSDTNYFMAHTTYIQTFVLPLYKQLVPHLKQIEDILIPCLNKNIEFLTRPSRETTLSRTLPRHNKWTATLVRKLPRMRKRNVVSLPR